MEYLVDTREQLPYIPYLRKLGYEYTIQTLPIGDYSLKDHPKFAIERKTLSDFINSITRARVRFERELQRAREELDFFAVIIECSLYDIENKRYRSKIHPSIILATLFCWIVKYRIPILLTESRTGGALALIKMAEAYMRYKNVEHR